MKGFVRILLASFLLAAGIHAVPVASASAHDAAMGCQESGCPPDPQACAVHCLVQAAADEPAASPAVSPENAPAAPETMTSEGATETKDLAPSDPGPPDPATDILLTIQKRE